MRRIFITAATLCIALNGAQAQVGGQGTPWRGAGVQPCFSTVDNSANKCPAPSVLRAVRAGALQKQASFRLVLRDHWRLIFSLGLSLMYALVIVASALPFWLVTAAYAGLQGWPVDIPLWVAAGGMAATLMIGGIAGLYPALRAARLAPTEALSAS